MHFRAAKDQRSSLESSSALTPTIAGILALVANERTLVLASRTDRVAACYDVSTTERESIETGLRTRRDVDVDSGPQFLQEFGKILRPVYALRPAIIDN